MLLAVLPEVLRIIYPVHVLDRWNARGQRSITLRNLITLRALNVHVPAQAHVRSRFWPFRALALLFFSLLGELLRSFRCLGSELPLGVSVSTMDLDLCHLPIGLITTLSLVHFLLDGCHFVDHARVVREARGVLVAGRRQVGAAVA